MTNYFYSPLNFIVINFLSIKCWWLNKVTVARHNFKRKTQDFLIDTMDPCRVCSAVGSPSHPCRTKRCGEPGCNFRLFDDVENELNVFHQEMHANVETLKNQINVIVNRLNVVFAMQPSENERSVKLLEDFEMLESSCLEFEDEVLQLKNNHPFITNRMATIQEDAEQLYADIIFYFDHCC